MKEVYYYLRRKKDNAMHRCGVVFLILADDIGARGVSLCSELDLFSKTVGIHKARGMAIKALKRRENNYTITRSEAIDVLVVAGGFPEITFRSEFNPTFSDFELDILISRRKI